VKPDSLSSAQQSELVELAAQIRSRALSTEPADRDAAERAAARLYTLGGLAPPRFAWFDSPLAARVAAYVLTYSKGLVATAPRRLAEPLARAVGVHPLGKDLREVLFERTRRLPSRRMEERLSRRLANHGAISGSTLANDAFRRLTDNPSRDLGHLLESAVVEDLGEPVRLLTGEAASLLSCWVGSSDRDDLVSPSLVVDGFGGQFDAPWAEFYRFMEGVVGPGTDSEMLAEHATIAASSGPWWPYADLCLMSERAAAMRFDDRGLAHGDPDPAITFRDGWKVFALEGVLMDESAVRRPESISLERIRAADSEEVRRLLIGRYGWEKFMHDTHAVVLDMDADADGVLRALMKAEQHVVLVCACTSTGRTFTMEVDPACKGCGEAAEWLAGGGLRMVGQS